MGSRIAHNDRSFKMSNASTSIFHATLAIDFSKLATSTLERDIALWFCSRDYPCFGSSIAGFELDEIPWPSQTFDLAKAVVLRVLESTVDHKTWRNLGTSVTEEHAHTHMTEFRALVETFSFHDAKAESIVLWDAEKTKTYALCILHPVYRHSHGCILCNYLRDYAPE
jgi:hypothetical protein